RGLETVRSAVDALQAFHPVDVRSRLAEADAAAGLQPRVDVLLARVVRGEGRLLVVVLVQQMAQVPRAVADVQLGVVQIRDDELRAAGVHRDSLRRSGQQLHQADRARARLHVGAELAL